MPVSGLVVSLCKEARPRAEAIEKMAQEPRITVGALAANRLAIVLDTASSEEDKQLWDWLNALPGVTFVQVAFVGYEPKGESLLVRVNDTPTATQFKTS
jgi:nitrate reductase NapAB chaperone NapD